MSKKIMCPLMQRPCIEDGTLVDGEIQACRFWVCVQGRHPQTSEVINNYDCSLNWQVVLMIENSAVNRQTGAEINQLRNENATAVQDLTQALNIVASAKAQAPQQNPQLENNT